MRRWLAGLLVGAFLVLLGAQAVHVHDSASAPVDSCAFCVLAHQAQLQAPSAAPAAAPVVTAVALDVVLPALPGAVALPRAAARAPPAVS